MQSALLAGLLPTRSPVNTFILNIHDENNQQLGLAQTRTRPDRPEQDIIFLSPALTHGNGSHAIWQRLLSNVCIKAGESGHHRIYARIDNSTEDALQIFRHVGFSSYTQEHIFLLSDAILACNKTEDIYLRKQTSADSWSLQRLYAAITPRKVQVAEGLAQGQWQISNHLFRHHGQRLGFVWESDGEILAVFHVYTGKKGCWFKMLIHPDVMLQTQQLLGTFLSMFGHVQGKSIYCSLRT